MKILLRTLINFFKRKRNVSIKELSKTRPVIQSNMNSENISEGIKIKIRELSDSEFRESQLKKELKHYK